MSALPVALAQLVGRKRFIAPTAFQKSPRPWVGPRRRNKAIAPYKNSRCLAAGHFTARPESSSRVANVNGALVGGASLKATDFLGIARAR
jgi:hypothetical protein